MRSSMLHRDFIILAGMAVAFALAFLGLVTARLRFVKVGSVVVGGMLCLGLACVGWLPLSGGRQTAESYFGCTMLTLALLGGALLGAVEEVFRRLAPPPGPPRRRSPDDPVAYERPARPTHIPLTEMKPPR